MNKKRKIIIIVSSCIFALILVSYALVINYFVDYSIARVSTAGDRDGDGEDVDKYAEDEKKYLTNVTVNEVTIESKDGYKLTGYEYINEGSDKWVISVHGYRSSHLMMLSYGDKFYSEGYNVLIPDLRCHGKSEGEYIGMGWLDKDDVLLWIDRIVKNNSSAKIVLHGVSMGGATVMMTSGEKLPDNVQCIIEDCGYTSVEDIFASELNVRFGLPRVPFVKSGSLISKIKAGYDWKTASSIEQVKKSKVPILFIHGDADDFVPCDMVYKVYDVATCEKDMLIIEGAGHTYASTVDAEAYWGKVFEFIGKYSK